MIDQQMKDKLLESIDTIGSWVESTKDFALEQAPLVVNEIVMWGIGKYSFSVLLGLIFLVISFFSIRSAVNNKQVYFDQDNGDIPTKRFFILLSGIISFIPGVLLFLINIYHLIFVLCAPRLYVIKTIADLFKDIK